MNDKTQHLESSSPEETFSFAEKFSQTLKAGDVVALQGNLGSGKTHFTKGLAQGLGINPKEVKSPTFTLFREYTLREGEKATYLLHLDLYRLTEIDEILLHTLDEYVHNKQSIIIIEWAEKAQEWLPENSIRISFEVKGEKERSISITTPTAHLLHPNGNPES